MGKRRRKRVTCVQNLAASAPSSLPGVEGSRRHPILDSVPFARRVLRTRQAGTRGLRPPLRRSFAFANDDDAQVHREAAVDIPLRTLRRPFPRPLEQWITER